MFYEQNFGVESNQTDQFRADSDSTNGLTRAKVLSKDKKKIHLSYILVHFLKNRLCIDNLYLKKINK